MKNDIIKEIPDSKTYPVLPPDMDYIYFNYCDDYPICNVSSTLSLTTAWWLCESAFLVYCHPGFARMAFKIAGFENFKFFHGKGTECMVTWNKKQLIITFRGTELQSMSTLHELKTDLDTKPVEFELGGMVHKGFLNGLNEIWSGDSGLEEFIQSIIQKYPKIIIRITGHSLGGALAALCFARIKEAHELYIFGSPKVGDREFVDLFKDRNVFRVEHNRDPIPMVPPNIPAINFNFQDLGTLLYIDEDGSFSDKRPEKTVSEYKSIVKNTLSIHKAKRKSLGLNFSDLNDHYKEAMENWINNFKLFKDDATINITDHMPIFYTTKLWNALVSKKN